MYFFLSRIIQLYVPMDVFNSIFVYIICFIFGYVCFLVLNVCMCNSYINIYVGVLSLKVNEGFFDKFNIYYILDIWNILTQKGD